MAAWQVRNMRGDLFSNRAIARCTVLNCFESGRGIMPDEVFQPGIVVPESGVYQVLHYRHRLYHEVTLLRVASFPACSECGTNVRFRLVRSAPPIEDDRNFSAATGQGAT